MEEVASRGSTREEFATSRLVHMAARDVWSRLYYLDSYSGVERVSEAHYCSGRELLCVADLKTEEI
jgi:hypothetical protein